MSKGRRETHASNAAVGALALSWVAVAVALLCVPFLPTHDGPQHVFAAWYENHFDADWAYFETYLTPNPERITSMGFDAWFRPLELLVGWQLATQLALLATATVWLGGWWVLARRFAASSWHPLILVVSLTALPWALYMGFFNFLAGLAWLGWALSATCAIIDAQGRARVLWVAALTGVMTLACIFHSFAACLIGLCVAVGALAEAASRRSLTLPLWFGPTAAPVAVWVYLTLTRVTELQFEVETHTALTRLSMAGATLLPGVASAHLSGLATMVPGLLLIAGGIVAGCLSFGSNLRPALKAWGALGVLFLLIHTLAPFDLASWHVFAPRWGLPGFAMALVAGSAALAERREGPAPAWVWALGLAIVLVPLGRLALDHRALWEECGAPYRDAPLEPNHDPITILTLEACDAGRAHRFPIVRFESNADVISAIANHRMPDVYAMDRATKAFRATPARVGSVSDTAAMSYSVHTPRGDIFGPPAEQDRGWLEMNAYLATEAGRRDASFVLGPAEQTAEIAARGFAAQPLREDLAILRFEGCKLRVPGANATTRVAMSFFPDERRLPAELVPTQSGPLATVPCGPVELLIWDDADEDGRPTERERACVEQSGDAELRRMINPGTLVDVGCVWTTP